MLRIPLFIQYRGSRDIVVVGDTLMLHHAILAIGTVSLLASGALADEFPWYTGKSPSLAEYGAPGLCRPSPESPAKAIERLRKAYYGDTTSATPVRTREHKGVDNLLVVEVIDQNDVYTFWNTKAACEHDRQKADAIPDDYE
jgi:hypothetical protein